MSGAAGLATSRLLWGLTALGLIVRLAFSLGYWVDKPITNDEREYLQLAASLEAGRGFSYPQDSQTPSSQQFGRAPVYPAFLALIGGGTAFERRPAQGVPTRVKVAQSVLGAGIVPMVALFAFWAAGRRAAHVAALIASIYPPLVWLPAFALSETLYAVLALGAAAAVSLIDTGRVAAGAQAAGTRLTALTAGVMSGAAVLTRPAALVFVAFVSVWLLLTRRSGLAVVVLLGSALVVAPWTLRNARVYDRFVLVASEGGVTFWTGNHPLAKGEGDMAANPAIKVANVEFRARYPGLSQEALEPLYYRDAVAYVAAHPLWWAGLLLKKLFYVVVPIGPSYTLHSRRYFLASALSYTALLPFAIAGAIRLKGRRRQLAGLWLLAASSVAVCLVFFPQERFRVPVIDPTLIVCAATVGAGRHCTVRG